MNVNSGDGGRGKGRRLMPANRHRTGKPLRGCFRAASSALAPLSPRWGYSFGPGRDRGCSSLQPTPKGGRRENVARKGKCAAERRLRQPLITAK